MIPEIGVVARAGPGGARKHEVSEAVLLRDREHWVSSETPGEVVDWAMPLMYPEYC